MKQKLIIATACLFAMISIESQANNVILPAPSSVKVTSGEFATSSKTISFTGNPSKSLVDYTTAELVKRFDLTLKKGDKNSPTIAFNISGSKNDKLDESYTLEITPSAIKIDAKSDKGAFYAVQSLLQLIRSGKMGDKITIAAQRVDDSPRFAWRAYMLDDSRYFMGEDQVLLMLDAMAELKMNIFHWHLTDDQGWRIESKKYPLLTQIGSKRARSQVGGFNSTKYNEEPHEGFYTQEQIKRIVAYAAARQIKVVPEIEMPGHASAAIASYPWLGSSHEKIEVPGKYGKHFAVFNVTNPKVVAFLRDLIDEYTPLFNSDVVHIGGDEVKFEHWNTNPQIVAHAKEKGYTSAMDIQIAFTNDMSRYISSKGLRMMGWNEILGKNLHGGEIKFENPSEKLASNVIVHFWKGDLKDIAGAVADGYQIVNSYHEFSYLDYGFSLKHAYGFNPVPDGVPAEYRKNIIGSGCQMWGEWTPTIERSQYQTFPRIAAFAEVGWSSLENKNYESFVERLKPIREGWKAKGITIGNFEK